MNATLEKIVCVVCSREHVIVEGENTVHYDFVQGGTEYLPVCNNHTYESVSFADHSEKRK